MIIEIVGLVVAVIVLFITAVFVYDEVAKAHCRRQGINNCTSLWLVLNIGSVYIHDLQMKLFKKQGKLYGGIGGSVTCSDADVAHDVLIKDFNVFPIRRQLNSNAEVLMQKMLQVLEGDDWKRIRSIMSPTFSTGKLKRMAPLIQECVDTMNANFAKAAGQEINVKKIFGAFTMEIVLTVAFGTKIDSMSDPDNLIVQNSRKVFDFKGSPWKFIALFVFPKLGKLLNIKLFPGEPLLFFKDMTARLIEQRKKLKEDSKRYDFLQLMIDAEEETAVDNGILINNNKNAAQAEGKLTKLQDYAKIDTHSKKLSLEELVAQCVLFFIAGYDTTASAISYLAYNLAVHPEAQEKLYKEIMSQKTLDYDAINQMKYLDAAVNESLRLYPPVIAVDRKANEEYTIQKYNVKVRKDQFVAFPIYVMHRSPEYFENPEEFIPERFFPENRHKIHPQSFMPFGAGPRNCIAMRLALIEVKYSIANCIKQFKLELGPNSERPPLPGKGQGLLFPQSVTLVVNKR